METRIFLQERKWRLETTREFIGYHNLAVVIPEDIASALQAEVETGPVRASYMAEEGKVGHWSDFTPLPGDCRYPFEDRVKANDKITPKMVDKMRRDEIARIDSASLRPFTTNLVMIDSASRTDTAKLFAQDEIYRANGGERSFFEQISPAGKLCCLSFNPPP